MAFTKIRGPAGITTTDNYRVGVITATKFVGPFDGVTIGGDGINVSGIVTATGLDINGNADISGNLTVHGDSTTLNTTLREVELLHVDANASVTAGIITQRGSGDILNLFDTTTEVMTVVDGGKVGINQATPEALLHIEASSSGASYTADAADTLILERNGGCVIDFRTPAANDGGLIFSDNAARAQGTLLYQHSDNSLRFGTNGGERLRLDSAGNLSLGKGAAASTNYGRNFQIHDTGSSGATLHLTTNDTGSANSDGFSLVQQGAHIYHWLRETGDQVLATAGKERLRITSAGDIEIGTQSDHSNTLKFADSSRDDAVTMKVDNSDDSDFDIVNNRNTGNITFATNSAEKLRIYHTNASGVGIAKFTSPASGDMLNLQNSTGSGQGLIFGVDTSAGHTYWKNNTSTSYDAAFIVGGSEKLRIESSGELWINTGTLKLGSTSGTDSIIHTTNAAGILYRADENGHRFQTYVSGWQDRLTIKDDGKVGINDTTPDSIFSVKDSYIFSCAGGNSTTGMQIGGYDAGANSYNPISIRASQILFSISGTEKARIKSDGNLKLPDSVKIEWGGAQTGGGDLYIQHDPTGSGSDTIDSSAGYLYINSDALRLNSKTSSWNYLRGDKSDGVVKLYKSNSQKLATSDTGISVTGEVAATQDYPTMRPIIDFNFAAVKKLDPIVTYTRSGPASYVNKDGLVVLVGENSPRFDHDPSPLTKESKGLLIEESRTNQWLQSEKLVDYVTGGALQQATLANAGTSTKDPTGGYDATKMVADTNGGAHSIYKNFTSGSNGNNHTFSVWVKAAGVDYARIYVDSVGGNLGGPGVTFSTGNTWNLSASGVGTQVATSAVEYPNGWWRLSVTGSFSNRNDYYCHIDIEGGEGDISYTGNNSNGIYLWGVQFENGSFPTSHIHTSGVTATRGADQVTVTGSDFTDFYNDLEGTFAVSHSILSGVPNGENCYVFEVSDGGATHIAFRYNDVNSSYSNKPSFHSVYNSGLSASMNASGTYTRGAVVKGAMTAKTSSFKATWNGETIQTDGSGSLFGPGSTGQLAIGRYHPSAGYELNGHIQRMMYWPKQLSSDQLVNLTS